MSEVMQDSISEMDDKFFGLLFQSWGLGLYAVSIL